MIEGKVARTFTKPWEAPDGRKLMLHSFKLEEYPDEYFRTGTKALGMKEGSLIRFEADAKNNVKPENVTLVSAAPVAPAQAPAPSQAKAPTAPTKPLGKESYWEEKAKGDEERQKAITYQAARKDALELVAMALKEEAIPLPEDATGRLAVITRAVDAYTLRYVGDTHRLAPPAEETATVEAPKKKRGRPAKAAPSPDQPYEDEATGVDLG